MADEKLLKFLESMSTPESPQKKYIRLKAEKGIKEMSAPVQTVDGDPITEITKKTEDRVKYRKAKKAEEEQLDPTGRTPSEAMIEFGEKKKKVKGLMQDEDEMQAEKDRAETLGEEYIPDETQLGLQETYGAYSDSSKIVRNINKLIPGTKDVDKVFRQIGGAERVMQGFTQRRDEITGEIMAGIGDKGAATGYYEEKARVRANQIALEEMGETVDNLEDLASFVGALKGEEIDLGLVDPLLVGAKGLKRKSMQSLEQRIGATYAQD